MVEKLKLMDIESLIEISWMYQYLSLNGQLQLVDDADSTDAKLEILYLAQKFDKEWNKHTKEEIEIMKLDYYEEIEKYAKKHLLISYGKDPTMKKLNEIMLCIDYNCPDGEFKNKLLKEVEEEMNKIVGRKERRED